MKKILLLMVVLLAAVGVQAQSDIVSVKDAISIFQKKTLEHGKKVLEKQGYIYKGISSDSYGRDYNWVKNMDLNKEFLPTAFKKGNSSMLMLAQNGATLYICVQPKRLQRAAEPGQGDGLRHGKGAEVVGGHAHLHERQTADPHFHGVAAAFALLSADYGVSVCCHRFSLRKAQLCSIASSVL